jgi:hypothetical protein
MKMYKRIFFFSCPKQYSALIQPADGGDTYEVVRIRSATLNVPATKRLNHTRMLELVKDFVEHGNIGEEMLKYDHTRRLWTQSVVGQVEEKIYRPVFRKGRLAAAELPADAPDELRYRTFPFGYRAPE